MIGRVLWLTAIILAALATTAVQLDRQSRFSPALSPAVPEPFRGFAQTGLAGAALLGNDKAGAVAEAEKLVSRRPYPAENLRFLAAAQFKAGDVESGTRTIQIAAKRGWRDTLAQESVLRLALAVDDIPEATRRYAALFLRTGTEETLLLEMGPQLFGEANGPGRQTFAEIVSGGERWLGTFLNRGPRVLPPDAFVEIVQDSSAKGAQFDCEGIKRATPILAKRDAGAAQALTANFAKKC
ncbi:MAG: hypothetical protein AAF687_12545 [Pseudomonadota bacterium]